MIQPARGRSSSRISRASDQAQKYGVGGDAPGRARESESSRGSRGSKSISCPVEREQVANDGHGVPVPCPASS